jgi:hypothetical protein
VTRGETDRCFADGSRKKERATIDLAGAVAFVLCSIAFPFQSRVLAICETTFTVRYLEPDAMTMTADGEFRSIRKIPLIPAAKKLYHYKEIDSA